MIRAPGGCGGVRRGAAVGAVGCGRGCSGAWRWCGGVRRVFDVTIFQKCVWCGG